MTSISPAQCYHDVVEIIDFECDLPSEFCYTTCNRPLSLILELALGYEDSRGYWSRGYKAHWLLTCNKLYLFNLDGTVLNTKITVNSLFPNEIHNNGDFTAKVFAYWYSGDINVLMGVSVKEINGHDFDCITNRIYKINKGNILSFHETYEETKTLPF